MDLASGERAPDGKVIKTVVGVVKNYLTKEELESLGRMVNAWLGLAGKRARRNILMTTKDWAKRLGGFLSFVDMEVLQGSGKVSMEAAKQHAESEFEKYRIVQDRLFESDFDKSIQALLDGKRASSRPSSAQNIPTYL